MTKPRETAVTFTLCDRQGDKEDDMNATLEASSALSPMGLSMPRPKGIVIGFWLVTALFCLQMGFTAYAQLSLPQVAEAFTRLGFPDYFRVELAWAKLLDVGLLLAPVPASRSGRTPAAPSPSALRSSPTSRWEMARRRGALQRAPACSGDSRTSSGVAWRPCWRAPDRSNRGTTCAESTPTNPAADAVPNSKGSRA